MQNQIQKVCHHEVVAKERSLLFNKYEDRLDSFLVPYLDSRMKLYIMISRSHVFFIMGTQQWKEGLM